MRDIRANKRRNTREKLKEDNSKCVDIGAMIEIFSFCLFWGEVMRAADDDTGLCVCGVLLEANEAEVGEGDLPVFVADQVGGFEIAVDLSCAVGDQETKGGLFDDRERFGFREAGVSAQELIEIFAFEELHDDVEHSLLGGASVEDLDDVRATELGDSEGFALKAAQAHLVLLGAGEHDLDSDLALESFLVGAKDCAHPTASDLFFEDEGADLASRKGGKCVFFGDFGRGMPKQIVDGLQEARGSQRAFKDMLFAKRSHLGCPRLLFRKAEEDARLCLEGGVLEYPLIEGFDFMEGADEIEDQQTRGFCL